MEECENPENPGKYMGNMQRYRKDKRKNLGDMIEEIGDITEKENEELEDIISKPEGLIDKVIENLDIDKNKDLDPHESRSLIYSMMKIFK
jgi:hypothetical protein